MATRYCGKVKIALTITNDGEGYNCVLTARGKRLGSVRVNLPPHLSHSIDAPIAYDKAAHAALSFATDEDERGEKDWGHLAMLLDHNDAGFSVRRSKTESFGISQHCDLCDFRSSRPSAFASHKRNKHPRMG